MARTEHAIRIKDPSGYVRFRRKPLAPGVVGIIGFKRGGGSEIQALRFDPDKFTMAQARAWAKAHGMGAKASEAATSKLYLDIVRKDADQHRVFGYASVAVTKEGDALIDLQGDLIAIEDLEEAAYDHVLHFHVGGEMHAGEASSHLIESMVFTPEKLAKMGIPSGMVPLGWWMGMQVPPSLFSRVRDGSRLMFSIEGSGVREPLKEKSDG
jgi:hypothetical protein